MSERARDDRDGAVEGCQDPWLGTVLGGKYLVLRRLARGGMGTVYEARHLIVERHFALKILHPEYAARPRTVQRFVHEAKAAGALASEQIVAVYDFGEAAGTPYLVMELLHGQDLKQLLARSAPLPVSRAVELAIEVCRGLAAAHAAGLVHRDLKPANVFVLHGGGGTRAKLLDFGVAKLKNTEPNTGEHALVGTLAYMAPEQVLSGAHVDHRVDIYALGVLLYEMLSGTTLHRGDQAEVLFGILQGSPPALDDVCQDLPPGLSAIVARALAREPDDRHASAVELADALQPFTVGRVRLAGATLHARDANAADAETRPDDEEPESSIVDSTPLVPEQVRTRSVFSRRSQLTARAALLLVGAATVWIYLRNSRGREVPVHRPAELAAPKLSPGPAPVIAEPSNGAVHATAAAALPTPDLLAPEMVPPSTCATTSEPRELPARAPPASTRDTTRAPSAPETRDLPAPSSRFDHNNPYINAKP